MKTQRDYKLDDIETLSDTQMHPIKGGCCICNLFRKKKNDDK